MARRTRDEVVEYVTATLSEKGFDRYDQDMWWMEHRVNLDGRSADTLLRMGYTRVVCELAEMEVEEL